MDYSNRYNNVIELIQMINNLDAEKENLAMAYRKGLEEINVSKAMLESRLGAILNNNRLSF